MLERQNHREANAYTPEQNLTCLQQVLPFKDSSKTVIWTAGVTPSPAGKWLDVETDHTGRVQILKDLTVPGHPEVFVVGDTSSLERARSGGKRRHHGELAQ
jgi:NADH dehydrogenase FAD-containing subunit